MCVCQGFYINSFPLCNLDVGGPLLAAVIHPGQWTVDSEGMGCPPECPPEPAMWPENLPTLLELPTGSQLSAEDGPGVGSLSVAHTALPTVPWGCLPCGMQGARDSGPLGAGGTVPGAPLQPVTAWVLQSSAPFSQAPPPPWTHRPPAWHQQSSTGDAK